MLLGFVSGFGRHCPLEVVRLGAGFPGDSLDLGLRCGLELLRLSLGLIGERLGGLCVRGEDGSCGFALLGPGIIGQRAGQLGYRTLIGFGLCVVLAGILVLDGHHLGHGVRFACG